MIVGSTRTAGPSAPGTWQGVIVRVINLSLVLMSMLVDA